MSTTTGRLCGTTREQPDGRRDLSVRGEGNLVTKLLGDDLGNYADLAELPVDADIAAELRALNDKLGSGLACLWQLVVAFDDNEDWGRGPAVWLDAGIGGASGALCWVERGQTFIPAPGEQRLGRDDDWLPYLDWSGTPCSVHGAAETPIELVFAAVAELGMTRRRPTCVSWVAVDRRLHRIVGPRIESSESS